MILNAKELLRLEVEASQLVERLSELGADSCRVFYTAPGSDNRTMSNSTGLGNFHAQYGQTAAWVERQKENTRVDTRREVGE